MTAPHRGAARRVAVIAAAALAAVLVAAACGGEEAGRSRAAGTPTSTAQVATTAPGGSPPGTASPVTAPPVTAPPVTAAPPPPDPGGFTSSVEPVPDEVRRRMDGISMRPGCPVGYDGLRYVRVSHVDDAGATVTGELVVAAEVADAVVAVFRRLHEVRFPIARMQLVDDFGPADDPDDGADDFASIEADNTSAFNCRLRTGSTTEFSQHSYGTAIDLNPLRNPYVGTSGTTSHPASVPYLERSPRPGVITGDGPVVAAFREIGWSWGGDWSTVKDYQHFSLSGR